MFTRFVLATGLLLLAAGAAGADPFAVGTVPNEPNWTVWGYTVDGQAWGNWLEVNVPWGTEAAMSGTYYVREDFLIHVDPATSGLADPHSVYDENWWNHDGIYGLGEFFDAGIQPTDQNYSLILSLGATDTWSVFYDANRNQIMDGASDHVLFGGMVSSYWNNGGTFYGVLVSSDGKYDGFFSPGHDEGNPDLVDRTFHAGSGGPIPEPAAIVLVALGIGGLVRRRRRAG